jgi:hypothetical protein
VINPIIHCNYLNDPVGQNQNRTSDVHIVFHGIGHRGQRKTYYLHEESVIINTLFGQYRPVQIFSAVHDLQKVLALCRIEYIYVKHLFANICLLFCNAIKMFIVFRKTTTIQLNQYSVTEK